jgi:hypothetical protein
MTKKLHNQQNSVFLNTDFQKCNEQNLSISVEICSYLFNEFVCKLGFFWYEWASDPRVPKKVQFTQERVEYKVFLFDDPLKIFKINLTLRFDKLSHLSKSVHIGENSQILIVSNKKALIALIHTYNAFVKFGINSIKL